MQVLGLVGRPEAAQVVRAGACTVGTEGTCCSYREVYVHGMTVRGEAATKGLVFESGIK